jgi:hydroxyacylglutathione hydrolase
MKELNRDGVPLLGSLPSPERVSLERLRALGVTPRAVVVDTRPDRKAFMAGHVPGSLHAPLGVSFAMIVGSYVDPDADIYLVADEEDVDEAVRSLVRVGYDRIVGWTPPSALADAKGLAAIERIDFRDYEVEPDPAAATILDVRGAAEFSGARVPGAINIAHTRLATRLADLPKDKPVTLYCRSGNRAAAAASFLEREGYDVLYVDGLFAEWPGWQAENVEVGAA